MSASTVSTARSADLGTLLSRAGEGSVEAFAAIYDELAPLVHGVTTAALSDVRTAERATTATFLQAWCHAPQYRAAECEPIPWILAIAFRVAGVTPPLQG